MPDDRPDKARRVVAERHTKFVDCRVNAALGFQETASAPEPLLYKGSPLQKPGKILIYDLAIDTDIRVDTMQGLRPRHVISGDEKPDVIAKNSQSTSNELSKTLAKTDIPRGHVSADTAPSANSLIVQGTFASRRQGDKTEPVTVGMGLGSAEVQTKIDVRLKTASEALLLSQFQTETTAAKNVGAAAPAAAGLNPAAVATK